ncbi:MAG: hypothetical protein QN198_05390, partial [Armatimonadota bacterium]|nr:hypothetical protein [Armatimonadota bacterium]
MGRLIGVAALAGLAALQSPRVGLVACGAGGDCVDLLGMQAGLQGVLVTRSTVDHWLRLLVGLVTVPTGELHGSLRWPSHGALRRDRLVALQAGLAHGAERAA